MGWAIGDLLRRAIHSRRHSRRHQHKGLADCLPFCETICEAIPTRIVDRYWPPTKLTCVGRSDATTMQRVTYVISGRSDVALCLSRACLELFVIVIAGGLHEGAVGQLRGLSLYLSGFLRFAKCALRSYLLAWIRLGRVLNLQVLEDLHGKLQQKSIDTIRSSRRISPTICGRPAECTARSAALAVQQRPGRSVWIRCCAGWWGGRSHSGLSAANVSLDR